MISVTKKYLEDGNNVCPFSSSKDTKYISDSEDFRSTLKSFQDNQAIVIETSSRDLGSFKALKKWARSTFLKVLAHATSVTSPELSDINIWRFIDSNIAPILNDDNSPVHVGVALYNKPIIAICMSPLYPAHHPRYAPNTIIVLVWLSDIENIGALQKVRKVMLKEHGSIYDAIELVLPLPPEISAN